MNAPLQITYSSRKHNSSYGKRRRRRNHYQRSLQQDVSSKQHLEWFLQEYLLLKTVRCDSTEDRGSQTMNHCVTFASKADFHLALNLARASSAEYPYTRTDFPDYSITFRRECHSQARGNMIVTSDGACDLFTAGGVVGCVAGSILPMKGEKGQDTFLCVELTKVPSQLHAACDEAANPGWPFPKFRGIPERTPEVMCNHLHDHEQGELRQLIDSIRKNLDREFGMALERRSDVVQERARQVKRLVALLVLEDERCWQRQWEQTRSTEAVTVKSFDIPPNKAKFVIGRQGSTINRMREETGASISLASGGDTVVLKGTQDQIQAAERAIRKECRMPVLGVEPEDFLRHFRFS